MGCHATRKLVTKSFFVSTPVLPAAGTTWGRTWGCPMWTWISAGSVSERKGFSSRVIVPPARAQARERARSHEVHPTANQHGPRNLLGYAARGGGMADAGTSARE